jgi:hypothetical protein
MSPTPDKLMVDASPDKRFFIKMLIKDIELIPAIVDLVDNSIDAARAFRSTVPMTDLWVRLTVSGERFFIEDNCGGMEVNTARKYAFRFGRPEDFQGGESSVGQFGIGMKRALFKLGNEFTLLSVAEHSRFSLAVNVPAWEQETGTDWTFRLNDDVSEDGGGPPDDRGLQIEVSQLHPTVAADLAETEVVGRLRLEIAIKHQVALAQGLQISVNEQLLEAYRPKLVKSTSVTPVHNTISISANGGAVEAEFSAGLAGLPSPTERLKDDADASQFTEGSQAGWYVYCNDRLVLAADKSPLTGWGRPAASYHPQYRRFRGYVYLRSKDPSLLPWNTTKTGLDQDAPVFRSVQLEMFRILQMVQAVINAAKSERADNDEDERPLNRALDEAVETEIGSLRTSKRFAFPKPGKRRTASNSVNVQYRAPKPEVERVMTALRVDSAAKAGRATFDHFVETELE